MIAIKTPEWRGWMLGLAMAVLPVMAQGEEAGTAGLQERIAGLKEENRRLRDLARSLLVGCEFGVLEQADGTKLEKVKVTALSGELVSYDSAAGSGTMLLSEGPADWAVLVSGVVPEVRKPVAGTGEVRKPGLEVSKAIVVIEGDAGAGTGFLVQNAGKMYLYTAAHVISGNKRLAVKLRDGRKITAFGDFEASDGADLVRLEVKEEVEDFLTLGSPKGQSKQGLPVFASGNAGGGGTVGYEEGVVKGVGAESIEIDAEVIQGNSGGPILDGRTHEVLGVVTHLVAARKDEWARETRFSEIRRFGCRLDREWKWQKLPIGEFLREGQKLKEVNDLNELAIIALQPDEWGSPRLREFGDHRVVKEIRALKEWVNEKNNSATGVSESDQKKKVISLFEGIRTSSRSQLKNFHPGGYVWFHREMAEQALKLREELDKACVEGIDDLR